MTKKNKDIRERLFLKRKYGKELLMDCAPYSKMPLPEHPFTTDFYGMYIVTAGKGSILIDNNLIRFKRGSLIIFQPHQVKLWKKVSSDFDFYVFIFVKEFIETFFQDSLFLHRFQFFNDTCKKYSLNCNKIFFNSIITFCETINVELTNLQADSHHYLRSLLYNILIRINRQYIKTYGLSTSLFQDNVALKLKQLLDSNIRKLQRVEDYAGLLNISRTHLNNISKKSFGFPVSEVIKERLVTEIKRDLLFTDKSMKEICFEMNFSDLPNFIRFFKKHTDSNPNEYRLNFSK